MRDKQRDNAPQSVTTNIVYKPSLLTTQEAAAILGISKRSLQEHKANREISFLKIGRSVRFRMEDIQAFIESRLIKQKGWKGLSS